MDSKEEEDIIKTLEEQQSSFGKDVDYKQHELKIEWRKAKTAALTAEVKYLRYVTNKLEETK